MDSFADIAPHLANPLVLIGFVLLLGFLAFKALLGSDKLKPAFRKDTGPLLLRIVNYGFALAVLVIILGFAYAFWQALHDQNAGQADRQRTEQRLQQRIAELEADKANGKEAIDALKGAIDALREQREEGGNVAGIDQALAALAEGDNAKAESIFRETLERESRAGHEANRKAADAAMHLGALLWFDDIQGARDAYARATRLDPDRLQAWSRLGRAEGRLGHTAQAKAAQEQLLERADPGGRPSLAFSALVDLGDVALSQGHLEEALGHYRRSLSLVEERVRQEPESDHWKRQLSVAHNKLGDVLRDQGNLNDALSAYQKSLRTREQLTEQDPHNAGWLRDLFVSHNKIGDVLRDQGNLNDALSAYQKALKIAEQLAEQDPHNAGWQTDLVVSYWKVSEVLLESDEAGRVVTARGYLSRGLEILNRLNAQDRLTARQQRWPALIEAKLGALE